MAKRPELEVVNGPLAGRRFAVGEGDLRLGRSSSNDIHIPDEELSRNHCLFERAGDDGIRVTDLASANGTYLNGRLLGNDSVVLKVGDRLRAGATEIKVIGEEPPKAVAGAVDLGFNRHATLIPSVKKRSPLTMLLWLIAIAVSAYAAYFIIINPVPKTETLAPVGVVDDKPVLQEVFYEKVDANSEGIFRFAMTLSPEGTIRVSVDDVPKEDRHITKTQQLDDKAREELSQILAFEAVRDIDREYLGLEPDPPALKSYTLRLVYSNRARRISIVNTLEPDAFRTIREKLEAFTKNQLGVWALQYSRDKLVALAESALEVARTKWEDREVSRGNIYGAVQAYKEALFYLDTVNPKPSCAAEARGGLETATKELEARYKEQRFLADRAINLAQWETAERELRMLLELVPDRVDDRNREASAKLLDVEKRIKGAK